MSNHVRGSELPSQSSTGALPYLAAPSGTLTYDYTNQAWVRDGRYLRCGHTGPCACYGRIHEGELQFPTMRDLVKRTEEWHREAYVYAMDTYVITDAAAEAFAAWFSLESQFSINQLAEAFSAWESHTEAA